MKDTNNMKMLIDIYCRFPKHVEPIKRTALQKMQLKCKSIYFCDMTIDKKQQMNSHSKPITSVDEMKNMHNEYNNVYYWSNDFVNQLDAGRGEESGKGKGKEK
jgi:hypothetical protein